MEDPIPDQPHAAPPADSIGGLLSRTLSGLILPFVGCATLVIILGIVCLAVLFSIIRCTSGSDLSLDVRAFSGAHPVAVDWIEIDGERVNGDLWSKPLDKDTKSVELSVMTTSGLHRATLLIGRDGGYFEDWFYAQVSERRSPSWSRIVRARPERQYLVIVFVPKGESLLVTPGSYFIAESETALKGGGWAVPLANEDPVECKHTGLPDGKATIRSSPGLVFEFQEQLAQGAEDDLAPCVLEISFEGEDWANRELQTVGHPSPRPIPGVSEVSSSQSPLTLSFRTHDGRWAEIKLQWNRNEDRFYRPSDHTLTITALPLE